ncbi:MAG: hypothetical protein M3173_02665 [Chloroflexota bacterium]|nr:hypothetical protein [Chloroflexota bacterium]
MIICTRNALLTGLGGAVAFILAIASPILAFIISGDDLSYTPLGSSASEAVSPARLVVAWLAFLTVPAVAGIVPTRMLGGHWIVGMVSVPVSFGISYFAILSPIASMLRTTSDQRLAMLFVTWSMTFVLLVLLVSGRIRWDSVAAVLAATALLVAMSSLPFVTVLISLLVGIIAWTVVPAIASLLQCPG